MIEYTVREFRDNLRKILEEAKTEEVLIRRYDDVYQIMPLKSLPNKPPVLSPQVGTRGETPEHKKTVGISPEYQRITQKEPVVERFGKLEDMGKVCKTHGLPVEEGRKTCMMKGCK